MTAAEIESRSSVPPPLLQVHGLEPRGEDDPADAGHDPGDHEDEDADARDVDAGAPRGLRVSADGIDVAAERRALREERQPDEEDQHQERRERQPDRLRAVHRERRAPGHAAGLVAWLQIATVPKQATATPANFAIGIHGLTDSPARRWPMAAPSSTRAIAP